MISSEAMLAPKLLDLLAGMVISSRPNLSILAMGGNRGSRRSAAADVNLPSEING